MEIAYILEWKVDHLIDERFDAHLAEFPGWENTPGLGKASLRFLPAEIYFVANFRTLARSGYPYNSVRWPIMSKRMVEILQSVGDFECTIIPLTMIDDTVIPSDRVDSNGNYLPHVLNHDFVIVLPGEVDVLDREKSTYRPNPANPNKNRVAKAVLKPPKGGFPPLFRVQDVSLTNFVSQAAYKACEAANLKGMVFRTFAEYYR